MSVNSEPLWITPAALSSMQEELDELTRSDAREDPAAQARAIELRALLRRAEVGSKPDDGLVEPGMTVTVRFGGDEETTTFLLGERELLGAVEHIDACSPGSPLGVAINGRHVGDRVSYAAPSGASLAVEIVAAQPYA